MGLMKQCTFQKYFFCWLVICCLFSLTAEKQDKRKIGDFAVIWQNLFGAQYSIKGMETHEPATWTDAEAHCRNKGKGLFYPRSWKDVESVDKEIRRRMKAGDLQLLLPIKVWTYIKADSPACPYFRDKDWLNKKIVNSKDINSTIMNQTYCAAINYNFVEITAESHPVNIKLSFFCEKPTETTYERPMTPSDKSTTRSQQRPSRKPNTKVPKPFTRRDVPRSTKLTEESKYPTDATGVTYQETEDTSRVTGGTLNSVEETFETTEITGTAEISQTASSALSNSTFTIFKNTSNATTLQTSKNTVQSTESTVQSIESTVQSTESTVQSTESTVQLTESTVQSTESTGQSTESTVQSTKSNVQETESTVNETESTVKETESTVRETESTVKETESTVLETERTVKETESTVHATENTVHPTQSTVQTTESTFQTNESTVKETESTVQTTKSTLHTTKETSFPSEEISSTTKESSLATQEVSYSTEDTYETIEQTSNLTTINSNMTEGTPQSTEELSHLTSTFSTTTNATSTEEPSSRSCEAKLVSYKGFEINLPETDFGQVAEPPCPKGTYGAVRWKCSRLLRSFEENAYVTCRVLNCSERKEKKTRRNDSEYISYIVTRLSMCEEDDDEEETVVLFDKMRRQRQEYQDMTIEANCSAVKVKKDMSMMLDMYDRLMDKDAKVWNKMKKKTRRATSMGIIKDTEETAWTIGCLMQVACITKENLVVEIFNLKQDQSTTDIQLALSTAAIGSVQLPGNLRPRTENRCRSSVQKGVVAAYRNVEYLDPIDTRVNISSGVIGVSVDPHSTTYNLPDNGKVRLMFYHPPKPKTAKALCVFLNWNAAEADETYGVWDTTGCERVESESTENFTVCECNHLTNFAVLMDFRGLKNSETDEYVLHILSILCCSLSSIALLLTIIIYLTIRSLRSRRSTITCNLAACLLGMNILIQTGFDRGSSDTVCKIVSALIQYCVLSAFFWMLLEGALLYQMVIVVFETKKMSLRILYAIAYGTPFFIVTLSSAVDNDTMIREYHCWPSIERGHIWSVLGPVVLVISVNLIILCLTLNAASKMDKMNPTKSNFSTKERKNIVKQRMKGVFSLTCLLGFTWIVGFLEVTKTPAAQYIFVVVNGLQGVFLFVSQVILNDNVYRKLFAIYKENFARFSSVTSSWNLMASMKAKPNLEEKQKGKVNEKDEFSTICINEPEGQKIPPPAPQASQLDLCKVRLRIMELAKEPRDSHPFGLNQESV